MLGIWTLETAQSHTAHYNWLQQEHDYDTQCTVYNLVNTHYTVSYSSLCSNMFGDIKVRNHFNFNSSAHGRSRVWDKLDSWINLPYAPNIFRNCLIINLKCLSEGYLLHKKDDFNALVPADSGKNLLLCQHGFQRKHTLHGIGLTGWLESNWPQPCMWKQEGTREEGVSWQTT